jgi:hypothetical protein
MIKRDTTATSGMSIANPTIRPTMAVTRMVCLETEPEDEMTGSVDEALWDTHVVVETRVVVMKPLELLTCPVV